MCGLTGMWQPGGVPRGDPAHARRGDGRSLVHRGPDDAGDYVDAAGRRRPRVPPPRHRRSVADRPPADAVGRRPLRPRLQRRNLQLPRSSRPAGRATAPPSAARSDTEVILELIARHGVRDAVPELWGMFAIAVWDTRDRALWLVRDRLGQEAALLRPCRRRRLAVRLGAEEPARPSGMPIGDRSRRRRRAACATAAFRRRRRSIAGIAKLPPGPRGAARGRPASRPSSRTGAPAPSSKRRSPRAARSATTRRSTKARRCCATRCAAG